MITKFARLEFELFTRPSKSDFLAGFSPAELRIEIQEFELWGFAPIGMLE